MKIYIANLAAYNAGTLEGKWFDLNDYTDNEEFKDAVNEWRKEQGIAECVVHDYDDCPAHEEFGEHPDFDELYMYHTLYEKYGDSFSAWFYMFHYSGCDCESWEDKYNESYMGEWESWEDFARYLIDDCNALGEIPDNLWDYIDYSAYAYDSRCNGDYVKHDGFFFQNY